MGVSHHRRGVRRLSLPLDIDECAGGLSQCGPFTVCLNIPGSYRCECRSGYRPAEDGQACVRKCRPCRSGSPCSYAPWGHPLTRRVPTALAPASNPCEDGTHPCAPADRACCLSHAGGHPTCECLPGYAGDGIDCSGTGEREGPWGDRTGQPPGFSIPADPHPPHSQMWMSVPKTLATRPPPATTRQAPSPAGVGPATRAMASSVRTVRLPNSPPRRFCLGCLPPSSLCCCFGSLDGVREHAAADALPARAAVPTGIAAGTLARG